MVEINKQSTAGFCPVVRNSQFLCAFISYAPHYTEGHIKEMKRHNDTDEVFVLLKGEATLYTKNNIDDEVEVLKLLPKTAYTVKASTWHHLAISRDAELFVTESGAIDPKNTDAADVSMQNITAKA